jgi:type IV pilus assembly protein PilC
VAIFSYVAKNTKGEIKDGEIEGKDARAIVENLRVDGFFVTSISEKSEKSKKDPGKSIFNRGVPLKEKMIFMRHLSVMLGSGLTLPRALNIISNQTKNKRFKAVIEEVEKDVKMGNALADSLAKQTIFDELSVNMIKVGEVSGRMEEVLKILANQLEKEHNLMSKVKGAMYYPSVILLVMVGVGIAMMTYVVPSLTTIFQDIQTPLPLSTRVIIAVSNYMSGHQLVVFSIIIVVVLVLIFFFKSSFAKKIVGKASANMPVIKNMVIKVNNARFARIYSSLTQSGVSVVESLKIIMNTLTNEKYREAFTDVSEEVQKGKKLHDELAKYPKLFPILTVQMVDVGEETGKTAEVLENLATFYEDEIDQMTKNLSSVIEPVLMVIIGVAVGFFAVSMILPMYSIMDQM